MPGRGAGQQGGSDPHAGMDQGGKLTALDPETGGLRWSAEAQGTANIVMPLLVDESHFLMTATSSALFNLKETEDGDDFELEAVFKAALGSSLHLPMLHRDHLYLITGGGMGGGMGGGRRGGADRRGGGGDPRSGGRSRGATGRLVCLDLEGNEKWRSGEDQAGYGTGNILLADGALYIQDGYSGMLRVVVPTPEGYQLKAEADLFKTKDARGDQQAWAPMALSRGRLLIRTQEALKCVDLRKDA